jgi:hypothetical protein
MRSVSADTTAGLLSQVRHGRAHALFALPPYTGVVIISQQGIELTRLLGGKDVLL